MARYIDIDKVIPTFDKNTWQGDMMISICENAEAEDVAPVVHAKWERVYSRIDYIFLCSACMEIVSIKNCKYNFCPNCGAKMDRGD